ncbi:hypothetical protein NP493_981g02039 [Ridgeia piscesae]|uniref:Uncharacterized protein n=1 Tax=Ridgeia piscesae TaxID=27915 RepID=A0AAD9NJ36_RIDPI|nr:hypothetical protein NP493_981g02039 [Ridgeia piscesae]
MDHRVCSRPRHPPMTSPSWCQFPSRKVHSSLSMAWWSTRVRQTRPTDLDTSTPSICTTTKLPNGVTRTGSSLPRPTILLTCLKCHLETGFTSMATGLYPWQLVYIHGNWLTSIATGLHPDKPNANILINK